MNKLVIANWKMNFTLEQANQFCSNLSKHAQKKVSVIVASPSIYLGYLIKNYNLISFSGQNISSLEKDFGAYTGEISAKMFSSLGIKYSILGHSERRKYNNEKNEDIFSKAAKALEENLIPIICIGESLEIRNSNLTNEFLAKQIQACIPATSKEIIVAYEPLWSIGTGIIPSVAQLNDVLKILCPVISKVAKNFRLVYGGSVTSQNINDLTEVELINGVLVGGSSLNFEEFIKIVEAYA